MINNNIRTILVRTSHPGNIGATARALKTMGLTQLCLVSPQQFPHPDATARAAGGVDVLENTTVAQTLAEALADAELVMATTSRHRTIARPVLTPRIAAQQIIQEAAHRKVAILFGSEQHGLTNTELELSHYQITIPSAPDYGVLNLASAVQIMAYEIHLAMIEHDGISTIIEQSDASATYEQTSIPGSPNETDDLANIALMESFYQHLAIVVQELGILNPQRPRQLMQRMRLLFNRARPDKTELNILRGILSAMQKQFIKSHDVIIVDDNIKNINISGVNPHNDRITISSFTVICLLLRMFHPKLIQNRLIQLTQLPSHPMR